MEWTSNRFLLYTNRKWFRIVCNVQSWWWWTWWTVMECLYLSDLYSFNAYLQHTQWTAGKLTLCSTNSSFKLSALRTILSSTVWSCSPSYCTTQWVVLTHTYYTIVLKKELKFSLSFFIYHTIWNPPIPPSLWFIGIEVN